MFGHIRSEIKNKVQILKQNKDEENDSDSDSESRSYGDSETLSHPSLYFNPPIDLELNPIVRESVASDSAKIRFERIKVSKSLPKESILNPLDIQNVNEYNI